MERAGESRRFAWEKGSELEEELEERGESEEEGVFDL